MRTLLNENRAANDRFKILFIALASILINTNPALGDAAYSSVDSTTTYSVVGDNAYFPFQYSNAEGVPSGFDIDVLRAVGAVTDLKFQIELKLWELAREQIDQGKADIITGIYYLRSRESTFNYSIPYNTIEFATFARKGFKRDVNSISDLFGLKVLVIAGDFMHDTLKYYRNKLTIIPIENQPEGLRALASGQFDCFVTESLSALLYINKHQLNNVVRVGSPVNLMPCCFGIKKGDEALLERINQGIKIIKLNGELYQLQEKWFNTRATNFLTKKAIYIILLITGLALIVIIDILLINSRLRKRVGEKTAELQFELDLNKKTNRELLHDQALLKSLLDAFPDAVSFKDEELNYRGANATFYRLRELTPEQLVGKNDFDLFPESVAEQNRRADRKVATTKGEVIQPMEIYFDNRNNPYQVESHRIPIIDSNGNLVAIMNMERMVAKHADNLKNTDNRESTKNSFEKFNDLFHNIRTNVHGIIGYALLLEKKTLAQQKREDFLNQIETNAKELQRMLDEITDSNKYEGKAQAIPKSTDQPKEQENIISAIQSPIEKKITIFKEFVDTAGDNLNKTGRKPQNLEKMENSKILVAEDEEANFLYLKEVLDEFDVDIIWAKNGKETVEFARIHKPVLLLLDIKMPIMNGLEALQILRTEFPNMPVIAQTAYAMDEERIKCLEAGCNDYLAKPILPDQIIQMVSKYLKK